jgi:hypothetical protein
MFFCEHVEDAVILYDFVRCFWELFTDTALGRSDEVECRSPLAPLRPPLKGGLGGFRGEREKYPLKRGI